MFDVWLGETLLFQEFMIIASSPYDDDDSLAITVPGQALTFSSTLDWLAMSVCWSLPLANLEQLLLKISCVQCCGGLGNDAGDGGSLHLPPAKWPANRPGEVLDEGDALDGLALPLENGEPRIPGGLGLIFPSRLLKLMVMGLERGGVAMLLM